MYTVVTMCIRFNDLALECYGPFKTKKEAQRQAKAISYPCKIFVEYLWGNIKEGKP